MDKKELKKLLDREAVLRNTEHEISYEKPDPILVARRYDDEVIALVCALFAYGKASQIVRFLDELDFSLLDASDETIKRSLSGHYYRFQKSEDIAQFFISLKRIKDIDSLNAIFLSGYHKEHSILDGLKNIIRSFHAVNPYSSYSYRFLIGGVPGRTAGASPYKRWNMYLRWMVRQDRIDMGLWSGVDKKDLIIPLDTHTFNVSIKLGLLERKTYDLKAAIQLTQQLKQFDPSDPVKYDFALYRIGQEGIGLSEK